MFSEEFLSAASPWLLDGEIVAAVALGIGILFETDRYKRNDISGLAFQLVMWGVVFETIFSILLFRSETLVADIQRSTISLQQDKIIALETPRHLVLSANFAAIGKKYLAGKKFDLSAIPEYEPMMLAIEIRKALLSVGMLEQLAATKDHWTPPNGAMPIGTILRPGIAVQACVNPTEAPGNQATTERILAGLLADSGLGTKAAPVFVEPWESNDCAQPDLLHVEVGGKILTPWSPRVGAQVVYPRFNLVVPTK